jgi:Pyruvate/2-oxoacid:ferredoxin oxidoreductase delta subunit
MKDKIYRRLAEHLGRLPGGFPSSDTGADLRLLERLFTYEEADLATYLTLDQETASAIAELADLPLAEVEQRLVAMAHKGLIFAIQPDNGPALYQAVPFIIGIYEFQVNNLSDDLLQYLNDYKSNKKQEQHVTTIPQMRTIPVDKSITAHLEALPYERVCELVNARERFAVAPCICRRRARMTGGGCDAQEESCLLFDEWADYYVHSGRGRSIEFSEVMEILTRADAANLVLQPNNSRDIAFLCLCCGCCCGILRGLQQHPKPSEVVASPFIAKLETDICLDCRTCLGRCQMQALAVEDERVALNSDRCIGCGLCVSTCPSGALTLVRKTDDDKTQVPVDIYATWQTISKAQDERH